MTATLATTAPNAVLDTLLDDSRRFSVEFGPTLANHLPMVLVALAGLGASDRRLRQYYAFYRDTNRLRPVPADGRRIDAGNWREHRGDRRLEGDYRSFFAAEARRLGAAEAERAYLPDLATGIGFCALHAVTGSHWIRLIPADRVDRALLIRHFWQAIAAVYPKMGLPALPDEAAIAAMREAPCPPWPEIAAAACASDDEHDHSLVF